MSEILVFPRTVFSNLPDEGVWPLTHWPPRYEWRIRQDIEQDESWLQLIPYLIIRDDQDRLWCYQRTGGDRRLTGAAGCGVGGHVERIDTADSLPATVCNCIHREAAEELGNCIIETPHPLAWLYENHSVIGRVHIGLIHLTRWQGSATPQPAEHEPLAAMGFLPAKQIAMESGFEYWSRLAAAYLLEHAK